MKKIVYIVSILVLILQVSLAQRSRLVIVEFPNGNIQKGEISRLPNDNRLRLQTPNGKPILFYPNEVRRITYEDGSPVVNIPIAQNRPQGQNQQGQQSQNNPQNRQGNTQQSQLNQQNRQGGNTQQSQSNQQNRQGNTQQSQPNQQNRQGGNTQQSQPNQQNRQGGNVQQSQSNQQNRQGNTQQSQSNQQTRQGNAQQSNPNQQTRQGNTQQSQPNQQTRQGNAQQSQSNQQNRQGNNQQSQTIQQNRQGNSQQNNKPSSRNVQSNEQTSEEDFLFGDEGSDLLIKPNKGKQQKSDSKNNSQKSDSRQQKPMDNSQNEDTDFRIRPKGIIEVGYTLGMGNEISKASRIELSLSYGVQITPGLFAGLGSGIHLYSDSIYSIYGTDEPSTFDKSKYTNMVIPIFADLRYGLNMGSIAPFVGLKAGYGLGITTVITERINENLETVIRKETSPQALGLYIAPSIGARFKLGGSLAANFSLGYTMQMRKYTVNSRGVIRSEGINGVTVRAGFEF